MGSFAPIRDKAGSIIGVQPKEDGSAFAATMAETMAAVGATEPEKEEPAPRVRRRPGRYELAGVAGGLVLALGLIAGLNVFMPAAAPVLRPTTLPAPTTAPTVVPTSTAAPTATPAPPTATPEPPPTPEPQVIYVPVE